MKLILQRQTVVLTQNNKQVDHAKDLDIVLPKYTLIEYSEHYSKASSCLEQFYRDETSGDEITHFGPFKCRANVKITVKMLKFLNH